MKVTGPRAGLPVNRLARFANDTLPWSILGALLRKSAWAEDPAVFDEWNDLNVEALVDRLIGTTMAAFVPSLNEERLRSAPWSGEEISIANEATKALVGAVRPRRRADRLLLPHR